ncbi:MAG: glycerophosphodiester phosphodiesterase family protein [Bacteroidetes bacterium]|nr:glycerophosphodiester phosphodiesterase family protein [Bacteroidota bacterium]
MPIYTIVKLFISISLVFCSTDKSLDIQGHRGARGLMPENTIPGFLKALDLGVTTLELDVVISKDQQVLVSHEPYFSHVIRLDSLGNAITKNRQKPIIFIPSPTIRFSNTIADPRSIPNIPSNKRW